MCCYVTGVEIQCIGHLSYNVLLCYRCRDPVYRTFQAVVLSTQTWWLCQTSTTSFRGNLQTYPWTILGVNVKGSYLLLYLIALGTLSFSPLELFTSFGGQNLDFLIRQTFVKAFRLVRITHHCQLEQSFTYKGWSIEFKS